MRGLKLVLLVLLLAGPASARDVTDMAGRVVAVPDHPTRIACLEVLCYPRVFMLGGASRLAVMTESGAPWLLATNPDAARIPKVVGGTVPNVEDLLAREVDVAIVAYELGQTLAKLAEAGIPALVGQLMGRPAPSAEVFAADAKAMVRMTGAVLGGDAVARAEDWCAYFDERVRFVGQRVAKLAPSERKSLYYVRGPGVLNTQGASGYTTWFGTMAGADMVVRQAPLGGRAMISAEDLIAWNPDVIIVGRHYPLDLVTKDPRLRDLAAVRAGAVHPTPEGVWYWDGGPEGVLLMQFVAKLLYPGLFADFDLAAEVKGYYARFYGATLSDGDVARLLAGQWPDGTRFNPVNN